MVRGSFGHRSKWSLAKLATQKGHRYKRLLYNYITGQNAPLLYLMRGKGIELRANLSKNVDT